MPSASPTIIIEKQFLVNTYVITTAGHALVIDPILTSELMDVLKGKIVDFALLTHEHYDHIRSVNDFKAQHRSTMIFCGKNAMAGLANPTVNLSRYTDYLASVIPFCNEQVEAMDYTCSCDQELYDGDAFEWEGHKLFIKELPGHSAGSIGILLDDNYLFSGDTLFKDYPTATRLPGGSMKDFRLITKPWLSKLPQDIIVCPGHTKPFQLKEWYKTSH